MRTPEQVLARVALLVRDIRGLESLERLRA